MSNARNLCARVVAECNVRWRLLYKGWNLDDSAMPAMVANNNRCVTYLIKSWGEKQMERALIKHPFQSLITVE